MRLVRHWGAIASHRENEEEISYMLIRTGIKVLNKKSSKYMAKDGTERESLKVTFSQDDDNIVGEINVRPNVYEAVEKGKEYTLDGEFHVTKGGSYITWHTVNRMVPGSKDTI